MEKPTSILGKSITFAANMSKLKKVYLLTGANLGDRFGTLEKVNGLLEKRVGNILKTSSLYETVAWGEVEQPNYLNQALKLETALPPRQLLATVLEIEKELGRTRRTKWESRVIDIDILFYANKIVDSPELTIPHPHLHRRNFVLVPMLEIAPYKKHPVFKKTIEELYLESVDELDVFVVEGVAVGS